MRYVDVKRGGVITVRPIADRVYMMTSYNGKEFAQHKAIANALQADFYTVEDSVPPPHFRVVRTTSGYCLVTRFVIKGADFIDIKLKLG